VKTVIITLKVSDTEHSWEFMEEIIDDLKNEEEIKIMSVTTLKSEGMTNIERRLNHIEEIINRLL
jgi:selenocysteine-specific translation elongation factor